MTDAKKHKLFNTEAPATKISLKMKRKMLRIEVSILRQLAKIFSDTWRFSFFNIFFMQGGFLAKNFEPLPRLLNR